MVRPVEGYITSQGNFFDDENEAELYEAGYELTLLCDRLFERVQGKVRDKEGFSKMVMEALWDNKKAVKAYLKAKEEGEKPTTEPVVKDEKTVENNHDEVR